MYIVLEIDTNGNPAQVQLFSDGHDAVNCFNQICYENELTICPPADLGHELEGTVMAAGDDVWTVYMIEREIN